MQRVKCSLLVSLMAMLLPVPPSLSRDYFERERAVYDLLKQAESAAKTNQLSLARSLLMRAADSDPTTYSAFVHHDLADLYKKLKNSQAAIAEAQTALKFDPNDDDAYYTLYQIYKDQDHTDTALFYLNKSAEVSTDATWKRQAAQLAKDYRTYKDVQDALKLAKEGKVQSAKKLLERAALADPSQFSNDVHSTMAFVLRRGGEPEKSIEEGKKALSYDANDSYSVYNIAIAYQDIGRFDDAIAWLNKYVGMNVSEKDRKDARDFIQNLNDDRGKVSTSDSRLPDYVAWMRYDGNTTRWPRKSLPIKLYIPAGTAVKGYRPQFASYVTHAFDTWCQSSGGKLSYKLVDKLENADINIEWVPGPILLNEKGRQRIKAGLATVHSSGDDEISKVRIQVSTVDGYKPEENVEDGECASVCMHEVGHSLGLGHSPNVSDVMFFSSSSKQSGLPTARDKATIAKVYADYPVISSTTVKTPPPKVEYLPPPMFAPPKLPDAEDIAPPFFLPPPIEEVPPPPMFTPPPLPDAEAGAKPGAKPADKKSPPEKKSPAAKSKPVEKKSQPPKKKPAESSAPDPNELFFTPPPQ